MRNTYYSLRSGVCITRNSHLVHATPNKTVLSRNPHVFTVLSAQHLNVPCLHLQPQLVGGCASCKELNLLIALRSTKSLTKRQAEVGFARECPWKTCRNHLQIRVLHDSLFCQEHRLLYKYTLQPQCCFWLQTSFDFGPGHRLIRQPCKPEWEHWSTGRLCEILLLSQGTRTSVLVKAASRVQSIFIYFCFWPGWLMFLNSQEISLDDMYCSTCACLSTINWPKPYSVLQCAIVTIAYV